MDRGKQQTAPATCKGGFAQKSFIPKDGFACLQAGGQIQQTLVFGPTKAQADIFDHLLAILPVFGLRVFQDCSDIYQEASDVPAFTDGIFPQTNLMNPLYPSDMKRIREIAAVLAEDTRNGEKSE